MEKIISIASEYHLVAIVVGCAFLLVVYFLFKSLIKIGLIVLIIVIAIGGYFYFQHPGAAPVSMEDAFNKAKTGFGKVVEKGQDAWGKGKELIGEGKDVYEKGEKTIKNSKETLDKGVEKGADLFEKGKRILEKIVLFFKAEIDDGKQQR